MAILTLLLPALDRLGAPVPAVVARWLARGDRLSGAKPGRDTVLLECFEFIDTAVPVAALTRSLDASDAHGSLWLRADPCYVAVDAVAVRMLACGTVDLSAEESVELTSALRPLFGDAGFPLEPATPARWYLRCPIGAQLPQFAKPENVLGDDLMRHLPQGENERQWRHLLNEAQVILHNHPVNARRAATGRMPVNSLWFWGAGRLPEWVRTRFNRIFSRDEVTIALARLASVATLAPTSGAIVEFAADDNVLLDLADSRDTLAPDRDWLAPLDATLHRRALRELRVCFESGERLLIKPAHRWRFWRRIRSA
jgi:hypothetical protein